MARALRQVDPASGFAPDPVDGFAYCRELPPDVPPGMTLDAWRRARHHGGRHHHPLRRHGHPDTRPRGAVGCGLHPGGE